MTALAEALLAAQRQAIGALSKAYVAGQVAVEGEATLAEAFAVMLNRIGCKDAVDQTFLIAALDVVRDYGAPAPATTNGKPESAPEPASEAQLRLIARLADEQSKPAPDGPLTKEQASEVISALKAGTYNPDAWSVPF